MSSGLTLEPMISQYDLMLPWGVMREVSNGFVCLGRVAPGSPVNVMEVARQKAAIPPPMIRTSSLWYARSDRSGMVFVPVTEHRLCGALRTGTGSCWTMN